MEDKDNQKEVIQPNSPKMRIIRLVVGMVIITLGILIFNISSKWYQEAEAKDAKEKAEHEQKIRELIEPDSVAESSSEVL